MNPAKFQGGPGAQSTIIAGIPVTSRFWLLESNTKTPLRLVSLLGNMVLTVPTRCCALRCWTSTLGPHYQHACQLPLAVCFRAHPVQIGDSDIQVTSRPRATLMTCASLPTSQADNDYDQQALSSWRYPELGWLLLATELSVLLDRGCGTVCRAMSLSIRLSLLFVENSNISFLVCLSLDIDCFLLLSRGP